MFHIVTVDFVLIVNLLFYFKGLLWVFNTSALQKLCPFFAKPPCNMWGLVMRKTGVRTQGWCKATATAAVGKFMRNLIAYRGRHLESFMI